MTVTKHPIQASSMIPKVLATTDIVQSIPRTKITTATEPTTRMTQTSTPLETKTMDTIETTPTVFTTSSIPTTLATTIDISTTDATVKKGRIRQMKKVNIFKGN